MIKRKREREREMKDDDQLSAGLTSPPADCRPLSLGHGHGHGNMDTQDLGACRVGCYRISIAPSHPPVYHAESQVFVYLVQFVMEFEFENENGSRDLLTEAITAHVLADVIVSTYRHPRREYVCSFWYIITQ